MSDRLRVLVVEDNPTDALIVRGSLHNEATRTFEVVDVPTLAEALEQLERREIDVVLLDLGLPDSEGLATLRTTRGRFPSIPLIVFTGQQDDDLGLQALKDGAQDYINKNEITGPLLARMLRYAIERNRAELEREEARRQLEELNRTLEQKVAERTALAEQRLKQLRQLARELATAEQRERRRIACLLHDDLQQLLVAAKLQIDGWQPAGHRRDGEERVSATLAQAIALSRSLTSDLSPPALYEIGLDAALASLIRRMRDDFQLSVNLQMETDPTSLNFELRTIVFEAVRELLFNVVKHSGSREATVQVGLSGDEGIELLVQDSGVGFVPDRSRFEGASGFGLSNLRHRVQLIGGDMHIDSAPDNGTRVRIRLRPGAGADGAAP
jgi:signal transduction histidine kinase